MSARKELEKAHLVDGWDITPRHSSISRDGESDAILKTINETFISSYFVTRISIGVIYFPRYFQYMPVPLPRLIYLLLFLSFRPVIAIWHYDLYQLVKNHYHAICLIYKDTHPHLSLYRKRDV